jgi:hypothetical protein
MNHDRLLWRLGMAITTFLIVVGLTDLVAR